MMVSSKGRYALRVMIYLAQNDREELIPLKEIAENQNIILKLGLLFSLELIPFIAEKGCPPTGIFPSWPCMAEAKARFMRTTFLIYLS